MREIKKRKKLKGICGVYPACDGAPNRICQQQAYGLPIGLGGVGSGESFKANYNALSAKRFITKVVGEHFTPDITFNFLGIKLSMPIIASSVAGPGKYNNCISEIDFCKANVDGCREAGSIAFRGDTYFYTVDNHPSLDSIHNAGGFGIPIFKPRSQESLKKLIKKAEMIT